MRNAILRQFGAMVGVVLAASLSSSRTYAQVADPVHATNQVLALMNQQRAAQGIAPLTRHCDLDRAATRHADDMAAHNFVKHDGSDGSKFAQRIRDAGYPTPTNENVFAGSPSPETAVAWWMESKAGHRDAILDPNSKEAGIAVAYRAGTTYSYYWVVVFGGGGGRTCPSPPTTNPQPATQEPGTLHLTAITSSGRLLHTIRRPDGGWFPFGEVAAGPIIDADVQVFGAGANAALQLCAITSDGGLWHTIRRPDGTWFPFGDVEVSAGERGRFVSVALADVNNELHLLGVTSDGKLWHTIRRADGTWFQFGDVKGQSGDPGAFTRVATAVQIGTQSLYVLASTADGRLYQTWRFPDRWTPFARLFEGSSDVFVDGDVLFAGAQRYLTPVTTAGALWLDWEGFGGTSAAGGRIQLASPPGVVQVSIGPAADASQLVHLVAVTNDGGLWHSLGRPGAWSAFGNVKGAAGDPGRLIHVSVDGVAR